MMKHWLTLALAAVCVVGCTKSVAPDRGSQRGESCASRNDCEGGLTCVGGRCVFDEIPIEPTASSCVVLECQQASECDPYPSAFLNEFCPEYQADCDDGDQFSCDQFDASCADWRVACTDNDCTYSTVCTEDIDCGFGGMCVSGECVDCSTNEDCEDNFGDEFYCDAGDCLERCNDDRDCPLFGESIYTCNTGSGRCEPTDCTLDRECAVLFDDPTAVCNDGTCGIPCMSDAECGGVNGSFSRCLEGVCTYVGCETDLECSIALRNQIGDGLEAVCQAPAGGV